MTPVRTPAAAAAPDDLPPPELIRLDAMLMRLKLTAIRDQLDTLLAEAARCELTLVGTVAFLCEREIARKDERRIEIARGESYRLREKRRAGLLGTARAPSATRASSIARGARSSDVPPAPEVREGPSRKGVSS